MTDARTPTSGGAAPATQAVGRWLLAAAFVLPLVLRALSITDRILDRDEAYWMASALRMRDAGSPMYAAGWDTKPPGVFALHRAALALLPDAPMLAVHALGAVLAGTACAFVAAAARRLAGGCAGAAAAVAFAMLDSTGTVRALAANTELVTYVPVAVMAWAIAAERPRGLGLPFAAGACAALAALAKQPALAYAPAAFAAILLSARLRRPPVRTLLAAAGGFALVLGIALAWLAASGAWDDFVACNVTIVGARARLGLDLAAATGYGRWIDLVESNAVAAAGALAAVVVGAWTARNPGGDRNARRALAVAGPLAAAGIAAALAGGAGFLHYMQLACVPFAILAGCGWAEVLARFASFRSRTAFVATTLLLAALAAFPGRLEQWRSRRWAGYDQGPVPEVKARIESMSKPGDSIFVWGMHPDLYVTARRAPASRFNSCGWLVGTFTGRPRAPGEEPSELVSGSWDLLFADLAASRPAVVVDSQPAGVHGFDAYPIDRFPRLAAWLADGYSETDAVAGYRIFRRRAE